MALERPENQLIHATYQLERYTQTPKRAVNATPTDTFIRGQNMNADKFDLILTLAQKAYQEKTNTRSEAHAYLNTFQQVNLEGKNFTYRVILKPFSETTKIEEASKTEKAGMTKRTVIMTVAAVTTLFAIAVAKNSELLETVEMKLENMGVPLATISETVNPHLITARDYLLKKAAPFFSDTPV